MVLTRPIPRQALRPRGADRAPAPPARAAAAPGPSTLPARGLAPCACGGGCPRCAGRLPVSAPGDAREREADRAAERALTGPAPEPGVLTGLSRARIHAGAPAARAAEALGARAFTVGRDIVFGAGQFRPDTREGRRLIAHELAHVAQQGHERTPAVQRQATGVVEMEPLTIRSTLSPTERAISGLDRLRGEGVEADAPVIAHGEEAVARNAPDPAARLPFTDGGWDAQAILTALGQYDTLPGTDSDAIRCVQAVAMASRMVDGPAAVAGFLRAMILEGMMSRPLEARQRTAIQALEHVFGRIETERATHGDLMWAQEALHDLFYNDVSGTPEPEILDRMAPTFELGRALERMNVWCDGPEQVMREAARLQLGEHLVVNTWQVVFNTTFDELSDQGIEVAEGRSTVVSVNGREVRIRRIRTDARPAHTAIDPVRDHRGGHQLLVMKDGATGTLRLYEPEITASGRHLEDLAADGSNFRRYFRDQPEYGIYHYIQILGKLTPGGLASAPPVFPTTP